MRLYRTFAGLRAISHARCIIDPQSTAALDVLKQLGSDPLYIEALQSPGVFSC